MGIAEAACAALALAAPLAADGPDAAPATASVVLRWAAAPAATAYDLQVAAEPTFAPLVMEERVAGTSYRWRHVPTRTFYWRVRSVDATGRPGAWSDVRSIAPAVEPPRLRAPAGGARAAAGQVDLSCEPSPLLRTYALEVARDPAFTERVLERTGPACAFRVPLPEAGRFHWRVRGLTAQGNATSPSAARTLEILPAAPDLLAPAPGEVVPFAPFALRWSRVRGALEYGVAVGTPDGPLAFTVGDLEIRFSPERPGVHTWTVAATGPAGLRGPAAATRSVEVDVVAPAPGAPADGAVLRTATTAVIDLAWAPVTGAVAYAIEIVRADSAEVAWHADASATGALAELPPGAYRWTVAARTPSGRLGPRSQPRALSVELLAPLAPGQKPVAAPGPAASMPGSPPGAVAALGAAPAAAPASGAPLRAGLAAAWWTNLARQSRPGPSIEIAARRPIPAGALGLSLRVSWFAASATVPSSDVLPAPVRASAHLFPVALLATLERSRGRLSLYGAAGAVAWIARVESAGEALVRVAPGGEVLVGAARPLRTGEAFLEIGGALGELSTPVVRLRTGGIFACAGWRLYL